MVLTSDNQILAADAKLDIDDDSIFRHQEIKTEEKVAKALSLVLSDNNVKAVLVNLFGGILRCDIAARGFVMCIEESQNFNIPLIVRMLGTNAEEGIEILKNSNLNVTFVDTLEEAASKISKYS